MAGAIVINPEHYIGFDYEFLYQGPWLFTVTFWENVVFYGELAKSNLPIMEQLDDLSFVPATFDHHPWNTYANTPAILKPFVYVFGYPTRYTFIVDWTPDFTYVTVLEKNLPLLLSFVGLVLCFFAFSNVFINHVWLNSFWAKVGVDSSINLNKFGFLVQYYIPFNRKWFFDLIINSYVIKGTLTFGYKTTFQLVDGFFQRIGPFGSTIYVRRLFDYVVSFQDGNLNTYATWIIWSVVFLLWIYFIVI